MTQGNIIDLFSGVGGFNGTLMKRIVSSKGSKLMSVVEFHEEIVGGKMEARVKEIRDAFETNAQTEVKVKGKKETMPLAKYLKQQLPYYVPQADVRIRRKWKDAKDFTGLAPIDIDHISEEQVEKVMEWAQGQRWVIEAHRSVSGKGVHLIVVIGRVESDDEKEYEREYKRRYAIVSKTIETQLGLSVDSQCKDVLRGFFVGYDPKAYLRPMEDVVQYDFGEEAEPGDTPETARKHRRGAKEPTVTASGGTAETSGVRIDKKLLNNFMRYNIYATGQRHTWWLRLGQRLRYKGVERDALKAYLEGARAMLLLDNLITGDDPLNCGDEAWRALEWGFDHNDAQEDTDTQPTEKRKRGRPRRKKDDNEEKNAMVLTMEKLNEMADFRRDTIRDQIQFREKKEGSLWKPMTDKYFNTIYTRTKKSGIKINKADFTSAIESLDNAPMFNPVMDFLDKCKAWDESQPDYISQLFGYLKFQDEQERDYAMPLLKKWFVSMVALWMGKVDTNQTMPVLKGPQNAGKTHFYRHMLPPELREYYKEITPAEKLDKDQRIALTGFLLIAFEEFMTQKSAMSNQIKAFISSSTNTDRAPYGRFHQVRQRRASIIASTNDDTFISDRNGSRRYLAFTISGTDYIGKDTLPYEGAYAQARWMVDNLDPSEYTPTKAEADEITDHNEQYVEPTPCEIMLPHYFRKPKDSETGESLTIAEIFEVLNMNRVPGLSNMTLGVAIRKLGIPTRRTKKGYRYYVMRVKNDERENEAKELGREVFHSEIEERDKRRQTGEIVPF